MQVGINHRELNDPCRDVTDHLPVIVKKSSLILVVTPCDREQIVTRRTGNSGPSPVIRPALQYLEVEAMAQTRGARKAEGLHLASRSWRLND
jgi:hypothetical protein